MDDEYRVHDMRVHVGAHSLAQSRRGAITCDLSVNINSCHFPESDWNDFAVVVLGWWCEGCGAMLNGSDRAEFWFMDGPYYFSAEAESTGVWSVRFHQLSSTSVSCMLDSRQATEMPNTVRIRSLTFAQALISKGEKLLVECLQRGWTSPDLDSLRHTSDALRRRLDQ